MPAIAKIAGMNKAIHVCFLDITIKRNVDILQNAGRTLKAGLHVQKTWYQKSWAWLLENLNS